jgi:hypothetical protein
VRISRISKLLGFTNISVNFPLYTAGNSTYAYSDVVVSTLVIPWQHHYKLSVPLTTSATRNPPMRALSCRLRRHSLCELCCVSSHH